MKQKPTKMFSRAAMTLLLSVLTTMTAWAQNSSTSSDSELRSLTKRRASAIYTDGYWNTLCLPFDVTLEGSPLEGGTLMELDIESTYDDHMTGYDDEEGIIYLFFKEATKIEANKPYIFKIDKTAGARGTEVSELMAPSFCDSGSEGTSRAPLRVNAGIGVTSQDGNVTFQGTLEPITIYPEDNNVLYLGDKNQLYYPTGEVTISSFNAYFLLNNGLTVTDIAHARMFTGGEDEITAVLELKHHVDTTNNKWYTLDGRKLDTKPTQKGVYIVNGNKVVIK